MPNIYKDEHGRWCTILVRQFRPQYEADTIEFPAGFISRTRSETAEQAAIRELKEETTKTGTVIAVSPPLISDRCQSRPSLQPSLCTHGTKKGRASGSSA